MNYLNVLHEWTHLAPFKQLNLHSIRFTSNNPSPVIKRCMEPASETVARMIQHQRYDLQVCCKGSNSLGSILGAPYFGQRPHQEKCMEPIPRTVAQMMRHQRDDLRACCKFTYPKFTGGFEWRRTLTVTYLDWCAQSLPAKRRNSTLKASKTNTVGVGKLRLKRYHAVKRIF